MSMQNALLSTAKGAPFKLGTRPIPTPGPKQVLVKNLAVAVNPVDDAIQKSGFMSDPFGYPAVGGSDAAGTVAGLGEGVVNWSVGDRVLYQGYWPPDRATFQEYTVADADRIAKIPAGMSYEQAATVPLGLATAAVGLYAPFVAFGERCGGGLLAPWEAGGRGEYSGKPALVLGGSSSVGQYEGPAAIQLLKLSGFDPIIATSSAHNVGYCKAAGATHVIDYKATPYDELAKAVAEITQKPIPVVYDAISFPETQKAGWAILAPGGVMVVTLGPSVARAGEQTEDGKRLARVGAVIGAGPNAGFAARMYEFVTDMLEKGDIKPNNVELLPGGLAGLLAGVERSSLSTQGVSGVKLVARLDEGQ
ncbi:GroES-like protein [Vararia minispora EC-137]|uniref:GroES-like protein n=1 Tax=Vararia minispora EC-137 TaxID=1314806 RepID=A0ACB8QFD8_9AGAM|nr:GroES-like protein [Vararia minispora EC-137]